jgi:Tol biopolymer transport system component
MVLALGLVGVLALAVVLAPEQTPTVSVAAGGSPDVIRVTGRGFQAGERVELRIGSQLVATGTADRDGAFTVDVQVPTGASGAVAAVGGTSGRSASTSMSAASLPEETDPGPPAETQLAEIVFTGEIDEDHDIYVVDPVTGEIGDPVTPDEEDDSFATWSPDRSALAFARGVGPNDRDLYTVNADGSDPLPLVTGSSDDWFPAWSKDDLIAFVRNTGGGNSTIWVVPLGGEPRSVPGLRADRIGRSPSWSPDGQTIAFWGNAEDPGNTDLYTVRPDGTGLQRLTEDALVDRNPAWSPDGKRIAFMSDRNRSRDPGAATNNADFDLYLLDVATRSVIDRLSNNSVLDGNPVWSPDGEQIAFYRQVGSDFHIFVMDVETHTERDLMPDRPGDNRDPIWR